MGTYWNTKRMKESRRKKNRQRYIRDQEKILYAVQDARVRSNSQAVIDIVDKINRLVLRRIFIFLVHGIQRNIIDQIFYNLSNHHRNMKQGTSLQRKKIRIKYEQTPKVIMTTNVPRIKVTFREIQNSNRCSPMKKTHTHRKRKT